MPRFPHQAGAYAEYLTAPTRHLATKPASLDHRHAGVLVHAAGVGLGTCSQPRRL